MTPPDTQSVFAARRQRLTRLRKQLTAGAVALFIALWGMIFYQLVSGHDPALASKTTSALSSTTGTSTASTTPVTTSSSGSTSTNSASTSSGSASTSNLSGSSNSSSATPLTTSQS